MTTLSDFTATTISGEERSLADYAGQVVLVVNTASACGLTPQFAGLEELYQDLGDEGFVVLGFPCNQFGAQDPGSDDEIGQFCQVNYGVTFPMFAKVDVNGDDAHPLFTGSRTRSAACSAAGSSGTSPSSSSAATVRSSSATPPPRSPPRSPATCAPPSPTGRHERRFLLVPLAVLGGFLAFVWHRLAVAPGWRPRWVRWVVAVVLVALTALALAGFDVWGGAFTPAQMRPAVWLGQAFLATCLYLFLGLVTVWLVCVGIWLVRWRHDHGREARRRLNRVARRSSPPSPWAPPPTGRSRRHPRR